MAEAAPLFVCRSSDLAVLKSHLDAAKAGNSRFVVLEAPLGGGKRALVGELVRALAADDDVLVIRSQISDEEDGLRALLNLYASLYGALHRNPGLRGRVEMSINAQLPQHGKRVQQWLQAFVEGLKKSAPAEGEKEFKLTLPRDNPLAGFAEILSAISRKITVLLDIQNVHHSQSVAFFAMLDQLMTNRKEGRLLLLLGTEPADAVGRAWMSESWGELLDRRAADLATLKLAPWGGEEVQSYLSSKELNAAHPQRIAEIALGRPAYVAELVDVLKERALLDDALEGATLSSLAPFDVDADELEEADGAPKENRKHAGADDATRIHYLAALLGLAFPSGLVADIGGFERDSVDDLLDASSGLVKEVQFSKPMGTWIYQFHRAIWRQAVLDAHAGDEDQQIAQRVATFMERFLVPRGYAFLVKTVRTYAEHGAPDRARMLKAMAFSQEPPDLWAMLNDLLRYESAHAWPDALRKTAYVQLLDRMVQNGDVDQTEKLVGECLTWARAHSDAVMEAWVLFAGSRLDYRRQDLYRGRDRARDALKAYAELGDKMKVAELHNHLALIEYTDGNPNAALDQLRKALETANVPPVVANVEFIRGLVARKSKKLEESAEHFRKSNELAGNIGMAALALEAGFHYGEALFAARDVSKAADVLQRVAQIAQALQNPVRERATAALLAQALGMQRHHEAALQMASRTLQLTQELRFEKLIPVDIYNVGYFQLQLGRATEAVSLFAKAKERASVDDPGFLRELSFHTGLAFMQIGEKSQAQGALRDALQLAKQTKDARKVVHSSEHLATLALDRGDKRSAEAHLREALQTADGADMKEERKGIRRRLDEIST